MKKFWGFTLVELMVVVALLVVLSGFILSWVGGMVQKNKIAQDLDTLFGILQEARTTAFTQKRTCGLSWDNDTFQELELRCDTDQDGSISDAGGFEIVRTVTLYTIFQDGNRRTALFNKEGFNTSPLTFCPASNTNLPGDSCILVSRTRIKKGTWDGTECTSDHCDPR